MSIARDIRTKSFVEMKKILDEKQPVTPVLKIGRIHDDLRTMSNCFLRPGFHVRDFTTDELIHIVEYGMRSRELGYQVNSSFLDTIYSDAQKRRKISTGPEPCEEGPLKEKMKFLTDEEFVQYWNMTGEQKIEFLKAKFPKKSDRHTVSAHLNNLIKERQEKEREENRKLAREAREQSEAIFARMEREMEEKKKKEKEDLEVRREKEEIEKVEKERLDADKRRIEKKEEALRKALEMEREKEELIPKTSEFRQTFESEDEEDYFEENPWEAYSESREEFWREPEKELPKRKEEESDEELDEVTKDLIKIIENPSKTGRVFFEQNRIPDREKILEKVKAILQVKPEDNYQEMTTVESIVAKIAALTKRRPMNMEELLEHDSYTMPRRSIKNALENFAEPRGIVTRIGNDFHLTSLGEYYITLAENCSDLRSYTRV